jgi:plasmid replication initiation protein
MVEKTGVIYKISFPSGKSYIGKTLNYDKRIKQHFHAAKIGVNYPMYQEMRKTDRNDIAINVLFSKEIKSLIDKKEIGMMEKIFITEHNTVLPNGFNKNCGEIKNICEKIGTVTKHNDLIKSSHKLSLLENRIILSCISQINPNNTLSHLDKFSVPVKDIEDLIEPLDNKQNMYKNLKSALIRLSERSITFNDISGERRTRWVYSVDYVPQSGCIDLFFSPHIIPFLSEIKDNFTQYKLEHVLNLKSSYGVRLYEILKSSMNGEMTLTVEWLKESLELPESYNQISNLKDRVLNPAINEINKHTDMTASYEQIKKGRSIIAFKFIFVLREDKKAKLRNLSKKDKPAKKDTVDNLQYYTDLRKRFGDKAPIPEDIKAEMKEKGLWQK